MAKIIPHIPKPVPPPEPTYDLVGLTKLEVRVIKSLLGRMSYGAPGATVYDTFTDSDEFFESGRVVSAIGNDPVPVYMVKFY